MFSTLAVLLAVVVVHAAVQNHDDDDDHHVDIPLPDGSSTIRLVLKHDGDDDDIRNLARAVQLVAKNAEDTIASLRAALAAETAARTHAVSTINNLVDEFTSVISVSSGEGTDTPVSAGLRKRSTDAACRTITLFGNVRVISGVSGNDSISCGNLVTGYSQLLQNVTGSHNVIVSAAATTIPVPGVPSQPSNLISGSANIVFGAGNNVQQRFGIVGGAANTQSNRDFTSILGGVGGSVSNTWGTIVTGNSVAVSGLFGVAITGNNNAVGGQFGVAITGLNNTANGRFGLVADGMNNFADAAGNFSAIIDGQTNFVNMTEGVIVDGFKGKVLAQPGSLGGVVVDGVGNTVRGNWAVDIAGTGNFVNSTDAVDVAGQNNNVTGNFAVDIAGSGNTIGTAAFDAAIGANSSLVNNTPLTFAP